MAGRVTALVARQPLAQKKPRGRGASPARTLAEHAYELIKERLVSARYVPGQFLQEASICAELKLGRTPVHQALHRLQQEGLLEIIPRKGILVRVESLTEVSTALEARTLVEPECAFRCAEKATDADLAALHALLAQYEKLRKTGDKIRLLQIDRRFHAMIAEIAGNQLIVDFLRPIHERLSRLGFLPHWQIHDFDMTGREHDKLMRALDRHDAGAARKAMREHIDSLRRRILSGRIVRADKRSPSP